MATDLRTFSNEHDKQSMCAMARQYPGNTLHVLDLPPRSGFLVRPLAGEKEIGNYVEHHQSVFESKNMTAEWRSRIHKHPGYCLTWIFLLNLPRVVWLHFVFVGLIRRFSRFSREVRPDLGVGACVRTLPPPNPGIDHVDSWRADKNSMVGHVEPLDCHKDYRQYALGRVAFSEGWRRLQALGAQNIYVEADSYRNTAFQLYVRFSGDTGDTCISKRLWRRAADEPFRSVGKTSR